MLLLAFFGRSTPTVWLYVDLVLIGAGLGLTMLTLLIAVQQAVERSKLGTATSLNQFSRSIGGAIGVAVMGAVVSAGLAGNLEKLAAASNGVLTTEQASSLAANPEALIEPAARAAMSPQIVDLLQSAMAGAIKPAFWVGAAMALLALFVTLLLPKPKGSLHGIDGERMVMAEQTTINARNQPVADES